MCWSGVCAEFASASMAQPASGAPAWATQDWQTLTPGAHDSDNYLETTGYAKDANVTCWIGRNVAGVTIGVVQLRARLRNELGELMDRGDRILLITHGTGSVIAYDVLWEMSHDDDLKEQYGSSKVEMWLTLGSPLGDRNIQKRLAGAKEHSASKFPANVISWHNVSAEDDYICHDNTLADDFKKMLQQRQVSAVHDYRVFNLAVRYGQSNPHSSVGYYIHPRVSKIIADWLG